MHTYQRSDAAANNPRNAKRIPLWLPYLQSVEAKRGGLFEFVYKGGEVLTKLDDISCIMVYGDTTADLSPKVIDAIVRKGIPIVIHRRNMSQPIYISGGGRPDIDDTLTHQLTKRQHARVTTHVTRQLLASKFRSMSWLVPPADLPQGASVTEMRQIEARHAKTYWRTYFRTMAKSTGHPEWTRRPARPTFLNDPSSPASGIDLNDESTIKNPVAQALDANSKFVSGVILRWIAYHHLSPHHGFLHEPTDYPALVYDLMEPYRGLIEQNLLTRWLRDGTPMQELTGHGINVTKEWFDTKTYVPLTRQIVTNQELLHGVVLSLKYYLLGRQRKFHIPYPGPAKGGRPPKVNFLLYGRHAGKTDFWQQAKALVPPEL